LGSIISFQIVILKAISMGYGNAKYSTETNYISSIIKKRNKDERQKA